MIKARNTARVLTIVESTQTLIIPIASVIATILSIKMSTQTAKHGHHDHGHANKHVHHHTHDHEALGKVNAKHYDQHIAGKGTMSGFFDKMYTAMGNEYLSRRPWYHLRPALKNGGSGAPVRMLDYACGNGFATRTMMPYVDEAVGIDVSEKSTEAYNAWARENGFAEDQVIGVKGNVMVEGDGHESGLAAGRGAEFDVILVGMALHHVQDPALMVESLARRLKVGTGYLVFVDWDKNGCTRVNYDYLKTAEYGATRKGFSKEEVLAYFEKAGCVDADYQLITSYTEAGNAFIARGRRQA